MKRLPDRAGRLGAAAAAAGLLVCSAAAAGRSHAITVASVGGARLGAGAGDYRGALGAPSIVTRLPGGLTRLSFADGLSVILRHNRGVAIITSSDEDRTGQGIGPCAPTDRLRSVLGRKAAPQRRKGVPRPVAYVAGRLAFATPGPRVAAVMLAAEPRAYLGLLLASAGCGGGEEE
jgi:hypothetical protein